MREGSKHLHQILADLVQDGSISTEQSRLVSERFEALDSVDSKKSIFAEIAAYLGGAFVFISVATLTATKWSELSNLLKFSSLALTSLLLAIIALALNGRNPMLLRLTSVLCMGSAISATAAVAVAFQSNSAPWAAFLAGCVIAVAAFYRYRSEILHIGAFGYLFLTGFMALGALLNTEPDQSPLYPLWWVALASFWIYLAFNRSVEPMLGYLMSSAALFLATQFMFLTDHRVYSYTVSLTAAITLTYIFLIDRRWPLLAGAVAITTFTTGEFVAATLGGSLGALIGLLTAGIALITSSLLAIKRLSH